MCLLTLSPNFYRTRRKQPSLGNVSLEVNTQCNITPNSQDAFMRRGTFVVSSSASSSSSPCRVLCLHALVFCEHACYWLTRMLLQPDLFSHKRKRRLVRSHLRAPVVLGYHCMFLCPCLCYINQISAGPWACLHPRRICVYWTHLCVCELPTLFFSFFLPLSACLCASAPNECGHRINSDMIKQLEPRGICDVRGREARGRRWEGGKRTEEEI